MVEVVATDEFAEWYRALSELDVESVTRIVDLLERYGVDLGYPYCSAIGGARVALRELRVKSGRKAIRVFYAFDPSRQAVLLLGGDKTGKGRFYDEAIPKAEKIFLRYLSEEGG